MNENRASVLVRLPKDLKQRLQVQAEQQGVSLNQMITYSLSREVAQLEARRYFDQRLDNKSKKDVEQKFWDVLNKVQDRSVPEWDEKT
ncbi:MAG: hypothetical protein ACI8V2_000644 [Candidatus Latescibacterota bacterium]|jgi:hypothetical protein